MIATGSGLRLVSCYVVVMLDQAGLVGPRRVDSLACVSGIRKGSLWHVLALDFEVPI
jgi:hypothetical protein